jgi:hypothetical protein
MPYIQVPIPSHTEFRALKSARFRKLADEAIELKQQIEAYRSKYTTVAEQLQVELLSADLPPDVKTIDYNGAQMGVVFRRGSKKLDKKKLAVSLMEIGVNPAIIDECSTETAGSQSLRLVLPGEEEDE